MILLTPTRLNITNKRVLSLSLAFGAKSRNAHSDKVAQIHPTLPQRLDSQRHKNMYAKRVRSSDEGLEMANIRDGASIMIGGFGLCGIPENLIKSLRKRGTKSLTLISNNAGTADYGIGLLLQTRQVSKLILSYGGTNTLFASQMLSGDLKVEFVPQGTLAERMRAGGAGIPAFYTPTGVGTFAAEGKEVRSLDGRQCLLESALTADFAFVKAYQGDARGNLIYRKTARNFNPVMATAARTVIAEVEELVPLGAIDSESVITPSIYVDFIVRGESYEKRIEQDTTGSKDG